MAIVGLFVAAFLLGLMVGIVVGWSAAPAVVWGVPDEAPEPGLAPKAVGMTGGLNVSQIAPYGR
jgi:hypothetical protein